MSNFQLREKYKAQMHDFLTRIRPDQQNDFWAMVLEVADEYGVDLGKKVEKFNSGCYVCYEE